MPMWDYLPGTEGNPFKAKINGNRIECARCGALLAKVERKKDTETIYPQNGSRFGELQDILTIKCKHKSKGEYCNTVNEILL